MTHLIPKTLLVAFIVAVATTAGADDSVRLPDLGGTSTRILSPQEAESFPHEFEQYMRSHELLVEDPLIRDYFSDMGFRLVSYSDKSDDPFHFFVLRDPSINAFAAPAGVIALNSGLILAAHDESEVAGVVAHEIAHVTQDHLARGLENQQEVSLPTMLAALGLAIAAGAAGAEGDAAQAILMGGMSLAQQFQINHTRQSEAEADRIGIALLARGGYDAHGMTRFFERLNQITRVMGEGPPELLRTHPLTINRIAEARTRAEQLEGSVTRDGTDFHYVQARLRAMLTDSADAEAWFRARIEQASKRPEAAMRYGLAMTLLSDRRLDDARGQVEWLLDRDPDRQLYQLLEAELLVAEGRVAESLDILESLYLQYPGNRLVTTQYTRTLMHERDAERAERAAEILRSYLRDYPDDVNMTELYARAADRAGDEIRAAEALAESYYMRGGIQEAIVQLERINEREDLDYYQRSRVTARLNQLRAERLRLSSRELERQPLGFSD
ncbi:M48 family metalloprotease [Wenzhouxiangella sediminis]|uniref:Putative beta-barrel assembly-enhancing protease n=1 Tax=Wenzhouxiangella sediminis TaxID=1792836 RepID=A0A3E1K7T6_9GAMM|nr:M48 family metalloprotease [Wenzhouxiangella sediminis]RFF30065.1 M48 family peptidase [Wenzhouxiangella sediminis]